MGISLLEWCNNNNRADSEEEWYMRSSNLRRSGVVALVLVMIAIISACWIIIVHRWNQRKKMRRGPKTWPIVGAAIEQFVNYHRMHDWILGYLNLYRTVVVPMPFTTYTYIADPANVQHILKTNFANYPKVQVQLPYIHLVNLPSFFFSFFLKKKYE